MIGLLEIIAGELETGVTRFVAVSVKTFVLSLGASLGLMLSSGGGAADVWKQSDDYCDGEYPHGKWWRIPLYLACCVAVLGQYRMPLNRYPLGMAVQLVAYEVQFSVFNGINENHTKDHLDTAASNILGGMAAVFTAYALSWIISVCRGFYIKRLLMRDERQTWGSSRPSGIDGCIFSVMRCLVKSFNCLRIGRASDILKFDMAKRLHVQRKELADPNHAREKIELDKKDQSLFLEAVVGAQEINIWSILMPAVYQLVPGSVIARFWFTAIFPPSPEEVLDEEDSASSESVFSNLMVISTSLALGLIIGFALVHIIMIIIARLVRCCNKGDEDTIERMTKMTNGVEGMYTADVDEDPESIHIITEENADLESGLDNDLGR